MDSAFEQHRCHRIHRISSTLDRTLNLDAVHFVATKYKSHDELELACTTKSLDHGWWIEISSSRLASNSLQLLMSLLWRLNTLNKFNKYPVNRYTGHDTAWNDALFIQRSLIFLHIVDDLQWITAASRNIGQDGLLLLSIIDIFDGGKRSWWESATFWLIIIKP